MMSWGVTYQGQELAGYKTEHMLIWTILLQSTSTIMLAARILVILCAVSAEFLDYGKYYIMLVVLYM